jgi:hypothetical protein
LAGGKEEDYERRLRKPQLKKLVYMLHPEDGRNIFLRNAGEPLRKYTTSYPRHRNWLCIFQQIFNGCSKCYEKFRVSVLGLRSVGRKSVSCPDPPLPPPWLLPSRFIEFNTEVACIITKFITQSCVTRQLKYLAATSLRFPSRRPWGSDVPCNLISFLHPVQFPSSDATEEPVGPQQG